MRLALSAPAGAPCGRRGGVLPSSTALGRRSGRSERVRAPPSPLALRGLSLARGSSPSPAARARIASAEWSSPARAANARFTLPGSCAAARAAAASVWRHFAEQPGCGVVAYDVQVLTMSPARR